MMSSSSPASQIAAVFPGQGSQSPQMVAAYAGHSQVAETIQSASQVLGRDLFAVIADKEQLDKTENTQPALLAVCVGVFRSANVGPLAAFAGHSLGEYAALVCTDAISFEDAIRLVQRRAELMRDCANGKMAAVLGSVQAVEECCQNARANGFNIWPANYNSPQQTVVAGQTEAVAESVQWTSHPDIKRVVPLPVSIPSHCPLMQPAADAFMTDLRAVEWQTPSAPVFHNVSLQTEDDIAAALAAQLVRPVRWAQLIDNFAQMNISRIYEFGPGAVLTGLARRIPDAPEHSALASDADF